MGIYAQFQTFYSLLTFATPLGLQNGIIKCTSEITSENDSEKLKLLYYDSIKLLLISSVFFSIFIFLISSQVSSLLLNDSSYSHYIMLMAFGIIFINFYYFFDSFIKGLKIIDLYVKISIISILVTIILSIPLIIYYGLMGAVAALFLTPISFSTFSVFFLNRHKLIPSPHNLFSLKFQNFSLIKHLLSIGFAFILVGVINQSSLLIVRKLTIDNLGIYSNGLLQCAFAFSINYFGIIFSSISAYLFPRFSALNSKESCNEFININYRNVIILITILFSIIYVFKNLFIIILYSNDFLPAAYLFKFQFVGDYFKAISWIFGLWLIPRFKLKLYIIAEFIFSTIFVLSCYAFLEFFSKDLSLVSASYLISQVALCSIYYFFYKTENKFKFNKGSLILTITSLFLIISVIIITDTFNNVISYIFCFILLFAWMVIILNKEEKNKIYHLLKLNRNKN